MPRVFISYTHDTPEHLDRVWNLSERLRNDGIDCRIDQHEESPAEGWPAWCSNQIEQSNFVLVLCSETYLLRYKRREEPGKGLGGTWEGVVITHELYNAQGKNRKFIPIVFRDEDRAFIPIELQGPTNYNPSTDDGYDLLFRRVTAQPKRKASEVASIIRQASTYRGMVSTAAAIDLSTANLPKLERRMENPFAPVFTVPLPNNPFFTERGNELAKLDQLLKKRGLAAITGMGGMGKTQSAAKYCYLHQEEYAAVLWVRAENEETLYSDFTLLAKRLNLPEANEQEQKLVVEAVNHWLDQQRHWLLVLDNVVDLRLVSELTRKAEKDTRHIVVTTQSQATAAIQRNELSTMQPTEGALLLLRRANLIGPDALLTEASPKDVQEAKAISGNLGGLPLALDQAAAYISETGCSLSEYIELMKENPDELLARRGDLDYEHDSLLSTIMKSVRELGKRSAAGADLVRACAFLGPDDIPEEIFTEGAFEFSEPLQSACADALTWNDTVAATLRFSLIHRNSATNTLSIHRSVQAIVSRGMDDEERRDRAEQVVRAVGLAFTDIEFSNWSKCERLIPHALKCSRVVADLGIGITDAARLMNQAGCYLAERARYSEAETLARQVVQILENEKHCDRKATAVALNNLAQLLHETNRLSEAEPLMRRVLDMAEKKRGSKHPEVAISLNNLAQLLQESNRYTEAEPLMRRALEIDERFYGTEHPNVATALHNLGCLLRDMSRLDEAEALLRRALRIDQKVLGAEHPDVATDLNSIGLLMLERGRTADAEKLFRRALKIDEKSYGPEHPSVGVDVNNLALALERSDRLAEAERLYRRALEAFTSSLGPNHPKTNFARRHLSAVLRIQRSGPIRRGPTQPVTRSRGRKKGDSNHPKL